MQTSKAVPHSTEHFEITPWPLPRSMWLDAAARLVSTDPRETQQAARQLVESAPLHGIDLGLTVASVRDAKLRQVCLPVLGSGRTAMLFVSRPGQGGVLGTPEVQQQERVAVVKAALDRLRSTPEAGLAQGLSLPSERYAIEAYEAAGLVLIAELRYLSRPLAKRRGPLPRPGALIDPLQGSQWPGGVEIRVYPTDKPESKAGVEADALLADAIEASYRETLDCPELREMRQMADVVRSHRQTGDWTPSLWWFISLNNQPMGCLLLNPCPAGGGTGGGEGDEGGQGGGWDSIELTYLGLAPEVRGCGLASQLLDRGIEYAERLGYATMRCAVDVRNTPAMKLYERAGFVPLATRIAHACSVELAATDAAS